MRYAVISKGLSLSQVEEEAKRVGAKNIRTKPRIGQLYCDLEDAAVPRLEAIPGLRVRKVTEVGPAYWGSEYGYCQAVYPASQAGFAAMFYQLRASYEPPITGQGYTIIIMDTGIRKTHISLRDKVVYEANCTDAETADDVFSHGTGAAYIAAGGRHAPGEESGFAPGAKLINIKVLNDEGKGTDETICAGIEEAIALYESAWEKELEVTDEMYPNSTNMSFGKKDTGDPDDPVRLAVEKYHEHPRRRAVFAAAGNTGPEPGTILLPASYAGAWAVGATTMVPFDVWEYSSRGPTPEGLVKPDLSMYGVNILVASSNYDEAFERKSGTSFASPMLCGGWGLASEWGWRYLSAERSQQVARVGREGWETFWSLASTKAEGAPVQKDNKWGLGMPIGDKIRRNLEALGVAGQQPDFTGLIGALAMMGLVEQTT